MRLDEHRTLGAVDGVDKYITKSDLHSRMDVQLRLFNGEDPTRVLRWTSIERTDHNGNDLRDAHADIRRVDINVAYLIVQLYHGLAREPLQWIKHPSAEVRGVIFFVLS